MIPFLKVLEYHYFLQPRFTFIDLKSDTFNVKQLMELIVIRIIIIIIEDEYFRFHFNQCEYE